jgi:hypothetical protein
MKDELIAAVLALIGAALVAVLTGWLTERYRDKAEEKKDRAVADVQLATQCDSLVKAVLDFQTAAAMNRTLWEGWAEHGRVILLAVMAAGGGFVRPDRDALDWQRVLSAFGAAGRVIERERYASKAAVAGLKTEAAQLTAALVPLIRHQDSGIRRATEKIITASAQGLEDQEALNTAMWEFAEAVRAVLPSWAPVTEAAAPAA